jgi:hypothetical protein
LAGQLLGRGEVPQIIMIGDDKDFVVSTFQVGVPLAESFKDT